MKRALTISIDYRRHWDAAENDGPWWPLLREFAQGAIDEEIQNPSHKASITYDPRKLMVKISSAGVKLPFSIWLLGESTKMDDERTIGGYGEGMKIATLVAVRNGIPITIRNGADEIWIPTLEADEAFPDKQVLKIEKKRQVRLTKSFDVEIVGVTLDIWDMFRSRVLSLKDRVKVPTPHGDLLLDEDERGKIYVKGIYVHSDRQFEYGYNLQHVKPDLDRRMTDAYDLRSATLDIWKSLAKSDDQRFSTFYALLTDGKDDVAHGEYLYDDGILSKLAIRFQTEHGTDAVPVWKQDDVNLAALIGIKAVRVSGILGRALTKRLPSLDSFMKERSETVVQTLEWGALTTPQQDAWHEALMLLAQYVPDLIEHSPKVVEFLDKQRKFSPATQEAPAQIAASAITHSSAEVLNLVIGAHIDAWSTPSNSRFDKAMAVWEKVIGGMLHDREPKYPSNAPAVESPTGLGPIVGVGDLLRDL
jgi:hypothetical protein